MRIGLMTFYFVLAIVTGIGVSATQLIEFAASFSDGSVDEKRLVAGSAKSSLSADNSGEVAFVNRLNAQTIAVSQLSANNLVATELVHNPTATALTGSIQEVRGSRILGNGTAFTSELQKGDTVRWDGVPIKVATIVSDSEFVAESLVQSIPTSESPSKLYNIYFFDNRVELSTALSASVPLPDNSIYPLRSVQIFFFASSTTAKPNLTLAYDGSSVVENTLDTDGNRTGRSIARYDPNLFPSGTEKDMVPVSMASDTPARLAIVAVVWLGQSASGGSSTSTGNEFTFMRGGNSDETASVGIVLSGNVSVRKMSGRCTRFQMPFYFRGIDADDISFAYIMTEPAATGYESFPLRFDYCDVETTDGSSVKIHGSFVTIKNFTTQTISRGR
jgi:hypothetical protein